LILHYHKCGKLTGFFTETRWLTAGWEVAFRCASPNLLKRTATFLAKLAIFGVAVEAVWVQTLAHNQGGY
ncbi:MAG: hypothetical protein P5681_24920, partial [Limnospira sp. PMC 894.15]